MLNPLILLAVFLLFTVAGVVLLFRGWRLRLVDQMPHCRTCEYNLTGLVSDVCPECGTAITPQQVIHGLRRRRPALMAAGLLLLLIPAATSPRLARTISRANWHQYYPLSLLLDEVENGRPQAVWELQRRLQINALSDQDMRRIVQAVLVAQERKSFPGWFREVVDMVGLLDAVGMLSKEEQNRLYAQVIDCTVHCRHKIRLGDPIPFQVALGHNGPRSILASVRKQSVSIDGHTIGAAADGGGLTFVRGGGGSTGSTLDSSDLSPGPHTIELRVSLTLFRLRSPDFEPFLDTTKPTALINNPAWADKLTRIADTLKPYVDEVTDAPLWVQTAVLSAEVEIVPADAPHPIGLIDDAALGKRLQKAITLRGVTLMPSSGDEGGVTAYTDFVLGDSTKGSALPANVAFHVILKAALREIDAGEMVCEKGAINSHLLPSKQVAPLDEQEVLVILRSNRDAALGNADIDVIWNGEIILGPIKVVRKLMDRGPVGAMPPASPNG